MSFRLYYSDARQRAFTLPMEYRAAIRADGKTRQSFDYVFDFTGEVDPESSDAVSPLFLSSFFFLSSIDILCGYDWEREMIQHKLMIFPALLIKLGFH